MNIFRNRSTYLKLIAGTILCGSLLTGCSRDMIQDVQNKGSFDTENFYTNQQNAFAALIGVYTPLRKYAGGFENMATFFGAGSDNFYAGGGSDTDGVGLQNFATGRIDALTIPASYWNDYYQGIARANTLLESLPKINMDTDLKNRYEGETLALRSLYYFNLVTMFGHIPLIVKPILASDNYYDIPQADPKDVYAQIEKDLLTAIPELPVTMAKGDLGRFSQGAAKALLGKIYLFDGKLDLAADQFKDVNGTLAGNTFTSMYGYKLLPNYNDLWNFSNKFNSESILEVFYSAAGNGDWGFWGSGQDIGNTLNQMVGPRSFSRTNAGIAAGVEDVYTGGWSFMIPTPDLVNFLKNDPRYGATIYEAGKLKSQGLVDYSPAHNDDGYFLKKFLPTQADRTTGAGVTELNFSQDFYVIRLADTYLMEAEALHATGPRAQALLDAVRARVGLPSVPVSLQAIKDERRRELAGEGQRWFDLVRWGDAPSVLASKGFVAGKSELLPIPFNETVNTAIKQNPGY